MSLGNDKERFLDFAEDIGNPYLAVRTVSSWARDVLKKYDNKLLTSEVLTWIIQGIPPKSLEQFDKISKKRSRKTKSDLEELLCYVDDEDVCNAVRMSYEESFNKKELSFTYGSVLDEDRQARVRILMRMLWIQDR